MTYLGTILLVLVLACFGYALILAAAATRSDSDRAKKLLLRAKRVVIYAAVLSLLSLATLAVAFVADDFSVDAVARYSSRTLPLAYKLSAVWAGSAGSLLLWSAFMFLIFARLIAKLNAEDTKLNALCIVVGSLICLHFTVILMTRERPFTAATITLEDGMGLNPLLQNFWMIIHPPLLFLGYSALLVPFVLTIAACLTGRAAGRQIHIQLRHWLLIGICFLTAGIVTGAKWSYVELGWGGYWAWDPVENASLLPWLIALAALHARIGTRYSDTFKLWTVFLAPLPFILSLLATFITRSGILASVHAFGRQSLLSHWLPFIVFCTLGWLGCFFFTMRKIPITATADSAPARLKAKILFWTVLTLAFTADVVGIATFWPVISKIFTASDVAVVLTRSFYDRVITAVAVLATLLLTTAVLADLKNRRKIRFYWFVCLAAAVSAFAIALKISDRNLFAAGVCAISAFGIAAVLISIWSAQKTDRRFAAHISHLGLFLFVFAAALACFETTVRIPLAGRESLTLGRFELTYDRFEHKISENLMQVGPEMILKKNDSQKTLWPHNNIYPDGQKTSEIALHSSFSADVYMAFDSVAPDMRVIITAKLIPAMFWLWLAMMLLTLGPAMAIRTDLDSNG